MLRKDKEITDRTQIDKIIHQAEICHLACSREDQPYVIPISFGYDGSSIFFHTAIKGKKIDILTANPRVCLVFEGHVKLIKDDEKACDWSFDYSSVIVEGEAKQIDDYQAKVHALNQIMRHYSGRPWQMQEAETNRTIVWSVLIEEISGKGAFKD